MDLTNRILKLLIIVAVIIGLSIAFLRGKIDTENIAVEVILDFHEVQEIAALSQIETVQFLKEIKRKGITSIILRPEENRFSNQAFDMICSAGMKVIPALRIDEVRSPFFDPSFIDGEYITTVALQGDMEQTCTNKDEVYLINEFTQHFVEKDLWLLFIGPFRDDFKRELGERIEYRYINTLELFYSADQWCVVRPELRVADKSFLSQWLQRSGARSFYLRFPQGKWPQDAEAFLSILTSYVDLLRERGFYLYTNIRFKGFEVDILSLMGLILGLLSAFLLLLTSLVWLRKNVQYILFLFMFILFWGLFFKGDSMLVRKGAAVFAVTLFPTLGISKQFTIGKLISTGDNTTSSLSYKKTIHFFAKALKGFFSICLLSVAGGLIGAGLVSDTAAIKGIGFPLNEWPPYIIVTSLVLLVYLNRFMRRDEESIPAFFHRIGDYPLKIKDVGLFLLILSIIGLLYISWDGIGALTTSCFHKIGDKFLSSKWLPICPVVQMLIGIPLYFIGAYLGLRGEKDFFLLLSLLGSCIGFSSFALAFTRINFPIVVILLTVFMNLLVGTILGLIIFLIFNVISIMYYRRTKKNLSNKDDLRTRGYPYA